MALDTFRVAQGVDARFLENTLTKDITPLEALYDLVDNAVDAARERILKSRRPKTDRYGLPSDYGAYRIRLRVGEKTVAISDNCTGIDEETLAKHAFVTGFVSQHKFGIGGFGIGLKRALFRLGTKYALFTDTGRAAAEMRFDKANLSASSQPLDATRAKSSGKTSTLLVIAGLEAGVSHEFAATTRAALSAHLSRRYGLYVKKGLRICVNGERVRGFGPGIRKSGPVSRGTLHISAKKAGVGIYVEAGMHEDYRLTQEADYASAKTGQLTDQYGWYFVCNDRIVRIASRDRNLGWSGSWHQEYYGFVGWVRFVAENPELLPWDTKKTSIDPNSSAFREVAPKLQAFAEAYRTGNRKARTRKEAAAFAGSSGRGSARGGNSPAASQGSNDVARSRTSDSRSKSAGSANDHNEEWNELLPDLSVGLRHPKIRALVSEACRLPLREAPYAASMLFRAVFEFALFEHLKQCGSYQAVRQMCFDGEAARGRAFDEKQKKNFRPTLTQALEWLNKNDEYFPLERRRECVTARNKFGAHLRELNGVVHEGDLISSGKLRIARDDTMPLLRFLLKTD